MKKLLLIFLLSGVLSGSIYQFFLEYPHPPSYEINPFPCEAQPDSITCGPTSAAMVLSWYGYPNHCFDVQVYTKTKWFSYEGQEVGLTIPGYLVSGMGRLGVPVQLRNGNLQQLKHYVSQRKPVIVLVRSGELYLHYCVVIGFDEKYIIIADPSGGQRRVLEESKFMGAWGLTHDLDGEEMGYLCPLCGGRGSYTWLGVSCDLCGGDKRLDAFRSLLKEVGVQSYTMLVPVEGR